MYATRLVDVKSAEHSRWNNDILDLVITVETDEGTVEDWPFGYHTSDKAPITLAVTEFLAKHPDFEIRDAPPLTAYNFHLNRRDVRAAFIGSGLRSDAVQTAIDNIATGAEREMLMVEWEETGWFRRDDPIVIATIKHWAQFDPTFDEQRFDGNWMRLGLAAMNTGAPIAATD